MTCRGLDLTIDVVRRWVYETLYRIPFVSVDRIFGSTADIERLVRQAVLDRIPPGRAITLGCGVGRESIELARLGFDVTGLDFSPIAIKKAKRRAIEAGVSVDFVVDDLTELTGTYESFDLVTDFGALNDMAETARDAYLDSLLRLTHAHSRYFMFCFRRKLDRSDVDRLFGRHFHIKDFVKPPDIMFPASLDCYLMIRGPKST